MLYYWTLDCAIEFGMKQLVDSFQELHIEDELCLSTGDSLYGSEVCRRAAVEKKNLVHQFRLTNKRKPFLSRFCEQDLLGDGFLIH